MINKRISPLVMAKPCDCLMGAPPARPGKTVGERKGALTEEAKEQLPDLGRAQRHHHWEIRRCVEMIGIGCFWFWSRVQLLRLFLRMVSSPSVRKAVKKAKLNIDKVMCRYHPCQERTSYSSSPTSPLASSKHCSTIQRVPKPPPFPAKTCLWEQKPTHTPSPQDRLPRPNFVG